MITRLIVSRVLISVISLLALATVIFFVLEVLPGDVAARVLGRFSTQEARQAFRHEHGIDRPIYERWFNWISDVVRGKFGTSLASGRDVRDVIAQKFHNTIVLGAYAFAIYIPISLFLAILAAMNRGRLLDNAVSLFNLIGISMPEFVLGTFLIVILAIEIPIFPVISLADKYTSLREVLHGLALPAITLSMIMAAYAIRMLRDNLIEVLESEYVRMARLRGVPTIRIAFFHALPNALLPTLNVTALNLAYLAGGVVIVERVFAYNGMGNLLVDAIYSQDIPVVEAVTLIISAIYILGNLFADVSAYLLNPRLRSN